MQSDFFVNNLHKMIKYVFYKVNIPTLICLLLRNIIIDKTLTRMQVIRWIMSSPFLLDCRLRFFNPLIFNFRLDRVELG